MRSRLPYVGGRCFGYRARMSPPTEANPVTIARRRVMSPVVFTSAPHGHGPDLMSESGLDDHHDMDEHEQQERNEGEEMDRAGGLIAAEQAQEEGKGGGHCRRHREASHHHQRRRPEDHQGVRKFLHQAVVRAAAGRWNPQAQMIDEVAPHETRCDLLRLRPDVQAEMAAEDARQEVHGAGQNEAPRSQEVETPSPAVLIEDVVGPVGADRTYDIFNQNGWG